MQIRFKDSTELEKLRVKSEHIIPLFVLVVIPILIFFSEFPYYPVIPSPYSWVVSNKTIGFPLNLTLGKTTAQFVNPALNYAQREEVLKNLPISYYPYRTIGFDVKEILRNESIIPSCPHKFGECTLSGYTMATSYRLKVGIPLLIISLVYAFYALKYCADDYFKKKGSKHAISEYELVKKILYIEIPLFVALTSIVFAGSFVGLLPIVSSANNPIEQLTFYIAKSLQYALQYSVTAGALWMLFHIIRKEFRYYLAKAFIKNMPDRADNVERLKWLKMALNSYNKYLLRNLKLQIDTSKLYPRLVIESNIKINDCALVISESFDVKDKLTPARWLSQTVKHLNAEELFLKPSFGARIITWGTLMATILPVVISVISVIFQVPKH